MTTTEAYIDFIKKLKTIYDEREADNIADWVFENVTDLKKWERRIDGNRELAEIHSNKIREYLRELLQNKPVQYVLNECWFYKRKFFVNENVLIPRPETEELVEWIIKDIQEINAGNSKPTYLSDRQANIIDIGTGSGCVSISLKKELSKQNVAAIDISEKALSVAKKNAEDLNAEIEFLKIDFLNKKEWNRLGQYDIIVSNPPYIPIKEKEILKKNVIDFEPGIALFVGNNDPYIFYEKIAEFSETHLKKNGRIYVEVHEEYANNVEVVFEKAGLVTILKKDIYGKERMVKAIKS
ncbi:MAG TPA: peptide chain release factor N(5)-glutamine methyltransferase, partial [Hanamia sp.]|nr:peptide chain release factor N(5)-glutamine methyltransferase [Hanamia sp.]